jgi:flagellar biosynthesis/type III secretory pathway chaperone
MLEATTAMTATASSVPSPELVAALEHGLVLQQLLQQEFDALREQNLDIFEALQPEKTQIFDSLIRLTGVGTESNRLEEPEWDTFKNLIADCRDMHRRNEILISRKLDAIRGTLQTLNGGETTASVEVYDRLGRMARSRAGRGYEEV